MHLNSLLVNMLCISTPIDSDHGGKPARAVSTHAHRAKNTHREPKTRIMPCVGIFSESCAKKQQHSSRRGAGSDQGASLSLCRCFDRIWHFVFMRVFPTRGRGAHAHDYQVFVGALPFQIRATTLNSPREPETDNPLACEVGGWMGRGRVGSCGLGLYRAGTC